MLSFRDIHNMLAAADSASVMSLLAKADDVRKQTVGDDVHIRGLIEISNHCRRNCLYCGLRSGNKNIQRYRIEEDRLLSIVGQLARRGVKTAVIQGGEDPAISPDRICRLVEKIKSSYDIAVTLSLGEYSRADYAAMSNAGADRYLLRHETTDEELHNKLRPDSSYARRRDCLEWIKESGMQTGAGMMIGLPGQTIESIVGDILFMKSLGVHMAGIGPFIPDPSTPLVNEAPGDFDLTMRALAATRIAIPSLLLPATTATGVLRESGRADALRCGANVLMVNATPDELRELYMIYPNKNRNEPVEDDPFRTAEDMIISIGRTVGRDYGHSPLITGNKISESNNECVADASC